LALTLLALLGAAMLLPGIIATRTFYSAAKTKEIDVVMPSMSTIDGLSLIGLFTLVVHFFYVVILKIIVATAPTGSWPISDPYRYLSSDNIGLHSLSDSYALFSGLLFASTLAIVVGAVAGKAAIWKLDPSVFYGPINELVRQGQGDNTFITAFILSKVKDAERPIAYEGTVVSVVSDADRFPMKIVLRDVAVFQPRFGEGEDANDRDLQSRIPLMTFESAEWHNLAFRVYRVEMDDV
jgi:hypothetical protein